jgi:hypothetical protein
MTESSPETRILSEPLKTGAFYQYAGIIRMAIDGTTLQDLTGTGTLSVNPVDAALLEEPGSPAWVDRMTRVRSTLVRRADKADRDLREHRDHFEGLRQAIYDMAVSKKWCGEYDEFAREWGLITLEKDFEVTMTVTVKARDEEGAIDFVKGEVGLESFQEEVSRAPEYEACEA